MSGTAKVTKISDANGQIPVRINSGTVPTPVRVKATLTGTNITTVSSNLSIAVGLPSQLNFSLSQETINIEGMNVDGTPNKYTIIASDRMGNPVPAGTAINFVSEGGQVEASRLTTITNGLGSATANFVSADPRPTNGRITILSYAVGEESFLDVNGDNVYGSGEAFQDLGDVFLSRAYTSVYDPVVDQFISLGLSGSKTCAVVNPAKDPLNLLALNASTPSVGGKTCDAVWGKAYVRRATETVLSTSASRLMWNRSGPGAVVGVSGKLDSGCSAYSIVGDSGSSNTYFLMAGTGIYDMPAQGSLSFVVSDVNDVRLNPMPAGTLLRATATTGIIVTLGGGSPVPNTSSATNGAVGFKFDGAASGTIFISTVSPNGLTTSYPINVTTSATPLSGAPCTQ